MRRTVLQLTFAAGLLAPQMSAAQSAPAPAGDAAGYRMTMVGTTAATGGMGGVMPSRDLTYRVRIRDGVMRMDVDADAGPIVRKGMYMLLDASTAGMRLVDTVTRQVVSMNTMENLDAMQGATSFTLSDTSSRLEDLGPGETVLGFPTRKYRMTIRYAMSLPMGDAEMSMKVATIATLHISDAMNELDPAFDAFRKRFLSSASAPGAGAATAQISALFALQPKGFAMISEQEMRMDMAGNETVMKSSSRVTEFARGGVPASAMTVPNGFKTVDMNAMMQQLMDGANGSRPPLDPASPSR